MVAKKKDKRIFRDKRRKRGKDGAKTKFTPEMRQAIKNAASIGANATETYIGVGISKQTYYNWKKKYPKFFDEIADLKSLQPLAAKKNIAKALEGGDIETSKWYLTKKDPEFQEKTKLEHAGSVKFKESINNQGEMSDEEMELIQKLREARTKRIRELSKKNIQEERIKKQEEV